MLLRLRRKSRQKLLITATGLLLILYLWQGRGSGQTENAALSTAEMKLILVYPPSAESQLVESMEMCRINRCVIAKDMALYNDSHAFVVSGSHVKSADELPEEQPANQLRFYYTMDPPSENDTTNDMFDANFNGVISYAKEAHVYIPFGQMEPIPNAVTGTGGGVDYTAGKTDLLAWMPDSCESESKREIYASDLQQHVKIDVYGTCGGGKPACSGSDQSESSECNAKQILGKTHKFYLALEKKICTEYFTSELWDALRYNMVPIVFGIDVMEDTILPEGSFVDIRNYESPELLAEHLIAADKNATIYNAYHAWRTTHRIQEPEPWQCQVCRLLHTEEIAQFKSVVYVDEILSNGFCRPPEEYFVGFENVTIETTTRD